MQPLLLGQVAEPLERYQQSCQLLKGSSQSGCVGRDRETAHLWRGDAILLFVGGGRRQTTLQRLSGQVCLQGGALRRGVYTCGTRGHG